MLIVKTINELIEDNRRKILGSYFGSTALMLRPSQAGQKYDRLDLVRLCERSNGKNFLKVC